MNRVVRGAATALLCLAPGWALAQASEDLCTAPGLTILTDGSGDVDGGELSPVPLAIDIYDLSSVQVAMQGAAGAREMVFTITVADLTVPPPNSGWYTSFKAPDGEFYGARMVTDALGFESFESYTLNTNSGGEVADGRFPRVIKPASGSYDAAGVITVIVPAADIGITSDAGELRQFNAGSLTYANIDYPVDPPDPPDPLFVPGGFALVMDGAPNDLSRRGTLALKACAATAKADAGQFGGGLGFALLLPLLALAGLRRRA
jgi:hypothetical protein